MHTVSGKDKIIHWMVRYAGLITFALCLVFFLLPFKPKPFGDGEYHRGALQLLQFIQHGFKGDVEVTKGLFTVLYYAIPYSLLQIFKNEQVLLLGGMLFNWINISFGVHLLFKAFHLGKVHLNVQAATLVMMNMFPIHIYYSMGILSEAAAFTLVCAFVYNLMKLYRQPDKRAYIFTSISLACFISVRPNFLPYAAVYLLFILLFKTIAKNKWVLGFSFIVPLLLLVWIEKKLDHSDAEFKKFQLVKGFVWSRYELRDEPFNWLPQHAMDEYASVDYKNNLKKRVELMQYSEANKLDLQKVAFDWMLNDMKSNPGLVFKQTVLKYFQSQTFVVTPLMKSKKSALLKWGIHVYINLLNYVLLIVVFYSVYLVVAKRKQFAHYVPLFFLYATAFITIFFIHSEQRYVFPTRPAVILLCTLSAQYFFYDRKRNTVEASGANENR